MLALTHKVLLHSIIHVITSLSKWCKGIKFEIQGIHYSY